MAFLNVFRNSLSLGPSICKGLLSECVPAVSQIQVRFAARKGTRERKEKIKRANKAKKLARQAQLKHQGLLDKSRMIPKREKYDESEKPHPEDDLYDQSKFKMMPYSFQGAVEKFREILGPGIYDVPDSLVHLSIELNLRLPTKKRKFVDKLKGVICFPHHFPYIRENKVVAFAKDFNSQEDAYANGAEKAGGHPLIKDFQEGRLFFRNFDYILAHPDIVKELMIIKAIVPVFPAIQRGTIGTNLGPMVHKFSKGIEYRSEQCDVNEEFGWLDLFVGRLNQPAEEITANIEHVLKVVEESRKEMTAGGFIRRAIMSCQPSTQKLKLAHWDCLPAYPKEEWAEPTNKPHELPEDVMMLYNGQKFVSVYKKDIWDFENAIKNPVDVFMDKKKDSVEV